VQPLIQASHGRRQGIELGSVLLQEQLGEALVGKAVAAHQAVAPALAAQPGQGGGAIGRLLAKTGRLAAGLAPTAAVLHHHRRSRGWSSNGDGRRWAWRQSPGRRAGASAGWARARVLGGTRCGRPAAHRPGSSARHPPPERPGEPPAGSGSWTGFGRVKAVQATYDSSEQSRPMAAKIPALEGAPRPRWFGLNRPWLPTWFVLKLVCAEPGLC
jgi:hypothetical protein